MLRHNCVRHSSFSRLESIVSDIQPTSASVPELPEPLRAPPPRTEPPSFRDGSFARARYQLVVNLLYMGVVCWALSQTGWLTRLGAYLVPLQYLDWIGIGLLVAGAIAFALQRLKSDHREFFHNGRASMVRVIDVQKIESTGNEGAGARIVAVVESAGSPDHIVIESPRVIGLFAVKSTSCSLKPGDHTAMLTLDEDPPRHQLYCFLGLDPEHEAILKNGKPLRPLGMIGTLLVTTAAAAGLLVLIGAFNAISFYAPVDFDSWWLLVAVAAGSIIGGSVGHLLMRREASPGRTKFNTGMAYLGFMMFGTFAVMGLGLTVNAKFDRSKAEFADIRVTNIWQTTHHFIIRDYEVEYVTLDSPIVQKHGASIEVCDAFQHLRCGKIEYGKGALGMRWIRNLHPCFFVPEAVLPPDVLAGPNAPTQRATLTYIDHQGNSVSEPGFLLVGIGDVEAMNPSDALAAVARQNLSAP